MKKILVSDPRKSGEDVATRGKTSGQIKIQMMNGSKKRVTRMNLEFWVGNVRGSELMAGICKNCYLLVGRMGTDL